MSDQATATDLYTVLRKLWLNARPRPPQPVGTERSVLRASHQRDTHIYFVLSSYSTLLSLLQYVLGALCGISYYKR